MTDPIQFPAKSRPHGLIDPLGWQGKPVPDRRWLVEGLVPLRNVTMLSGDGGLGKSQIALQLLVACALGRSWLGLETMRCKCIGVFCEDEGEELHRRLGAVLHHYGAEYADLEDLVLFSRVGIDNALMTWQNAFEPGEETGFAGQVMTTAVDFGCQLIVLDSLHDLFAGNENSRPQARQFIQSLRTLATETDGAVLLTAHPSLSGRNTGTGEAGSTAWSNAVRARLYLTQPAEVDESPDLRFLETKKQNYGARANRIALTWNEGVFLPEERPSDIIQAIQDQKAERAYLACLDAAIAQGRALSEHKTAANFAPKVMAKMQERVGFKQRDLEAAQERLFSMNQIQVGAPVVGPDRHKRRGIMKAKPAGQDGGTTGAREQ